MTCADITALSALFDSGELDAARAAAFARHLEECHACARQVAEQRELDEWLRAEVHAQDLDTRQLENQVRQRIAADQTPRPVVHRRLLATASIAAVLVAAILVYRASLPPRLYVAAARDHHSEIVEQSPRTWVSDPASIASLAERAGVSAAWAANLAPAGYRFEHGRLCRLDGRLFLHLVFTANTHEFSLFLRQCESGSPHGAQTAEIGTERLAAIQTSRVAAMCVSDESREQALSFASAAAAVL
jgi:anti-sigma factor RsiW